jgi:hypothetical protein
LLCMHTAGSSELTIETLEACGPQDIPQQQIATRVRAIATLDKDTLQLHALRSNRLRFLAGQSVTLGIAGAGDDLHATYPSRAARVTTGTCICTLPAMRAMRLPSGCGGRALAVLARHAAGRPFSRQTVPRLGRGARSVRL